MELLIYCFHGLCVSLSLSLEGCVPVSHYCYPVALASQVPEYLAYYLEQSGTVCCSRVPYCDKLVRVDDCASLALCPCEEIDQDPPCCQLLLLFAQDFGQILRSDLWAHLFVDHGDHRHGILSLSFQGVPPRWHSRGHFY
eukprot:3811065-Rhodomonas_salina.1